MTRIRFAVARAAFLLARLGSALFVERVVFLGALALICVGVAAWSIPTALIVGGALLIADLRT